MQNAVGDLVDEGLVDPAKIGVTGESYGGGVSLQLATLKDRVMNPDGTLSPWRSPGGTPLSIAAAAPMIPWSDLAYSLVPNGHTVDTGVVGPTRRRLAARDREAVVRLRPVRARPGERHLRRARQRLRRPTSHLVRRAQLADVRIRSERPGDPRHDPALPLGLLPARRQVRLPHRGAAAAAHRQRLHRRPVPGRRGAALPQPRALALPERPGVPVRLGRRPRARAEQGGRQRAAAELRQELLRSVPERARPAPRRRWGTGATPPAYTALTQTCPASAASGGPYTASSWAGLHPGQVTFTTTTAQTVSPTGGSATVSQAFDPITGPGPAPPRPPPTRAPGVASYRLPAATGSGYTLLGSPTVVRRS